MSNFYVVCGGGDLLRDYREVEHNDECDAFIRHDSIRQRLLAAAQIPSGTINFASLSSIVHSMAIHPLSCTEITTVLWTIPVCHDLLPTLQFSSAEKFLEFCLQY